MFPSCSITIGVHAKPVLFLVVSLVRLLCHSALLRGIRSFFSTHLAVPALQATQAACGVLQCVVLGPLSGAWEFTGLVAWFEAWLLLHLTNVAPCALVQLLSQQGFHIGLVDPHDLWVFVDAACTYHARRGLSKRQRVIACCMSIGDVHSPFLPCYHGGLIT